MICPVSQRQVDPDPSITSAIGRHHSLPTAVADIVDNSVDAGAQHVLIRFTTRNGEPAGLAVIDDGHGMDTAAIDAAMTYARRRTYQDSDLGHFGIGLKTASLSQADTLIVWSKRYGAPAVGRRLRRETIDTGPIVEDYATADAHERLLSAEVDFALPAGTIVEWEGVRTFLRIEDHMRQRAWLESTIEELLTHLGLVLHRILERGDIGVVIEQYDVDLGPGAPRTVKPLDPFGYDRSGVAGFPADLHVTLPEGTATVRAHVWPSGARAAPAYVLGAEGPLDTQGLYVYRRDRLLQAGGWCELTMRSANLAYARLSLEIGSELEQHVTINPEKTGVILDSTLIEAMRAARTTDGRSLQDLLIAAEDRSRESRKRRPRPVTVVEPRGGLPSGVLAAFEEAAEFHVGEESVELRWVTLPSEEFFRVDRDGRCLALNLRYREAVVGHRSLDPSDAPLVKSLLYLLVNEHFTGSFHGSREKRRESAWQKVLVAAAREQLGRLNGGEEH